MLRPILAVLAVTLGGFVGLGAFTFYYAEGFSYVSNDPQVCAKCHVMNHQYESWGASGHHHVATCNDCHLPIGGLAKWISKARNGWNHSIAFTLDRYHKPIQIKPYNKRILQANCVRCHQKLVNDAILIPSGSSGSWGSEAQSCIHCHRNTGHMPQT